MHPFRPSPPAVRGPARRLRALAAGTAAVAVAVLLASCGLVAPQHSGSTTSAGPDVLSSAPAGLKDFYAQSITWSSCEKSFECAKVKVPVDYANPAKASIELAAIRLPASGHRQGSVLVNPGGPGGSGYNMVRDGAKSYFSDKLRGAFDIVGWDPRGVQRSAPVTCISDADRDKERQQDLNLDTDAGYTQAQAQYAADARQCQANTGPILGFVDTVSSAKDMDILRAVLNEKQLNYMGFSYGTKLGATYAGLFPKNVGKFSLDGALDPSLSVAQVAAGQNMGFDRAFQSWAAKCSQDAKCPVHGSAGDVVAQVDKLRDSYVNNPQRARDGRVVTSSEFTNTLAFAMYSTDLWDPLEAALGQAFSGDPSGMLALADYSADRDKNGNYTTNTAFAFQAVNCLDYPTTQDKAAMRAEAATLEAASPTFGSIFGYSDLSCYGWPYKAVEAPQAIHADGAAPILVVGTTRDPATPYEWAQALRRQLSSGVLITWNGDGHTAYGRSNSCITNAVDGYFVDGKVPADNTTC
ncbi:MAG: alpha/beta hydrolase [Actinomycetales bacterium]